MQSKKHSRYEALANMVVGVVINWLYLALIMSYLIGLVGNIHSATITTIAFMILSTVRSYIIRRVFNKIK